MHFRLNWKKEEGRRKREKKRTQQKPVGECVTQRKRKGCIEAENMFSGKKSIKTNL